MQAIDIFFIALVALMVIHGFVKGFVEELFSWAAMVLSIWAAVLLFPAGAALIREKFMPNVRIVPEIFAFIIIFLVVMLFIKLLERLLRDVITGANLGSLNKLLGVLFGMVEGFAFIALIIFVLRVQPLFDAAKLLEGSVIARFLSPLFKILPERGQELMNAAFLAVPAFPARKTRALFGSFSFETRRFLPNRERKGV